MADEIKKDEPQDNAPVEKELSPLEQKAATQGWVPQDEWEGDPEQWRPAKEFLDRGELFKKIDEQNRTIKEFKRAMEDLAKHNSNIQKIEYERALATLKAQKKEALLEGDADAVVDIDERMAVVKEAQKNMPDGTVNIPIPQDEHPVFKNWKANNSWYEANEAMRAYADRIGAKLGNSGMDPSQVLTEVTKAVKEEFAHKFKNPNRDKPGAVESGGNKGGKSKDTYVLSDLERRVMQRIVSSSGGKITEAKYIADLKKINGVS